MGSCYLRGVADRARPRLIAQRAYARARPYLPPERWTYGDETLIGSFPGARKRQGTMEVVRPTKRAHRLEGDALVGLVASTEHLTVTSLRILPGGSSPSVARGGDALVFVERGVVRVETEWEGAHDAFELGPWDAAYVPVGGRYRVVGAGDGPADAIVGVAPTYAGTA